MTELEKEVERQRQSLVEHYKILKNFEQRLKELEKKMVYVYENHPYWLNRHTEQIKELGERLDVPKSVISGKYNGKLSYTKCVLCEKGLNHKERTLYDRDKQRLIFRGFCENCFEKKNSKKVKA